MTAHTDTVLYALDREDFLAAVTGHPQSAEAAETVMSARLAGPAATGYRSRDQLRRTQARAATRAPRRVTDSGRPAEARSHD